MAPCQRVLPLPAIGPKQLLRRFTHRRRKSLNTSASAFQLLGTWTFRSANPGISVHLRMALASGTVFETCPRTSGTMERHGSLSTSPATRWRSRKQFRDDLVESSHRVGSCKTNIGVICVTGSAFFSAQNFLDGAFPLLGLPSPYRHYNKTNTVTSSKVQVMSNSAIPSFPLQWVLLIWRLSAAVKRSSSGEQIP